MATAVAVSKLAEPASNKSTKANPAKKLSATKPAASSIEDKRAARAAQRAAAAADKKAREEGDFIEYQATKFLVSMWFGMHSVRQGFKKNRSLPPEAALCLMFIGTQGPGGECEVGIQMRLRPSGFDREEAALLAGMGTASLFGANLARRVKSKPGDTREDVLQNNVLTAKGQKLYELVKRSVLATT